MATHARINEAVVNEAVVLAGGLGTRLRDVVPDLPKPLAPVAGRPFLAWILDQLASAAISRVILAVGYRHEQIQQCFGSRFGAMSIEYALEREPLGTGGAIRNALPLATGQDVYILNGDSFASVDLAAMAAAHREAGALFTMCTVRVPNLSRYGEVITADGRVVEFAEKRPGGVGEINAGIYLARRDLLERFDLPNAFSFERDVLAAHVHELRPLAFPARGHFIDIGVPEDYARAQEMFAAHE